MTAYSKSLLTALLTLLFSASHSLLQATTPDNRLNDVSSITLDSVSTYVKGQSSFTTFFVNCSQSCTFLPRFLILGGEHEVRGFSSYPLLIDDVETTYTAVATESYWHVASVTGDDTYYLSAGNHKLTLRGTLEDIPNAELILSSGHSERQGESVWELASEEYLGTQNADLNSSNPRHISYYDTEGDPDAPPYLYEAYLGQQADYTFRKRVYLQQGSIARITSSFINNFQHTVFLYSESSPGLYSWAAVSSPLYGGANLIATIPQTGFYHILAVANTNNSHGKCNITINKVSHQSVSLSRCAVPVSHAESGSTYACFAKGGNSIMWILHNGMVKAWNDDYAYTPSTSGYAWGSTARIDRTLSNGDLVLVSASNVGTSISTDIYVGCKKVSISSSFPQLKDDDALRSSGSTSMYNCISWALGEWTFPYWTNYIYGDDPANLAAFDSLFSAYGYTRNGATASNAVIDLWATMNGDEVEEYTHASIKAKGNDYSAGYDWESKLGSIYRIFHPRNDLAGNLYGQVVEHYWRGADLTSGTAGENHLPVNLRLIATASLSEEERTMLDEGYAKMATQDIHLFECLFNTCNTAGSVVVSANLNSYEKLKEYKAILDYCMETPKAEYAIFKKVEAGEPLALKLLIDCVVAKHRELARKTYEYAEKNSKSADGKLVVRPLQTDAILFIKNYLNELKGALTESKISLSNEERFHASMKGDKSVIIDFDLAEETSVSLYVASADGMYKRIVKNRQQEVTGNHTVSLQLPSAGLYVVTMVFNGEIFEKKIQVY